MTARLLLVTTLALIAAPALAQPARRQGKEASEACPKVGQRTPLSTVDGAPAFVDSPFVVPGERGWVLFGEPAETWVSPSQFSGAAPTGTALGLRVNRSGVVQARVMATHPRAYRPRGLTTNTGETLVVWGVRDGDAPDRAVRIDVGRLERDSIRPLHSVEGSFEWSNHSGAFARRNADAVVAASYVQRRGPALEGGILLLRDLVTRPSAERIPTSTVPEWVSAASLPSGGLVVAYTGDDPRGVVAGRQVLITITGRPGAPSVVDHRIPRAPGGDAIWPTALTRTTGRAVQLVILWARLTRRGVDAIMADVSSDYGQTWRSLGTITISDDIRGYSATLGSDGTIHVVTSRRPSSAVQSDLRYFRIPTSGAPAGRSVLGANPASLPTVSRLAGNGVVIAWSEVGAGALASAPRTFAIEVRGACE